LLINYLQIIYIFIKLYENKYKEGKREKMRSMSGGSGRMEGEREE